jgi:hypothetical protein
MKDVLKLIKTIYNKFMVEFKGQRSLISSKLLLKFKLKKYKYQNDIEKYLKGFRDDVEFEFTQSKLKRELVEDDDYDNKLFEIMTNRIENYQTNTIKYGNNIMLNYFNFSSWDRFVMGLIRIKSYFIAFKLSYKKIIAEPYKEYLHKKRFEKNMDKHFRYLFRGKKNTYKKFSNAMYNSYILNNNIEKIYNKNHGN